MHGENGELVWLKQTINNAFGLYAILHSVCNVPNIIGKRKILLCCYMILIYIEPSLVLNCFAESHDRTTFLETDEEIARLYKKAALRGPLRDAFGRSRS